MKYALLTCLALSLGTVSLVLASGAAHQSVAEDHQLAGLKWRNIGPFRGGRVSAVCGVPGNPGVFYIGLPEGGVWKTTSAGQTWYPVFDSIRSTSSIGSLQVAPSQPQIVYAGSGEISGGSQGAGVYKSEDAGATWKQVGLEKTKIIPSLWVDPKDANTVLAAAFGAWGDSHSQLGVFRTTDGGKSWTKTLAAGDHVGVQHLAWAPDQPAIVYAVTRRRQVETAKKAVPDPDVTLWRSMDSGQTWMKLAPTGLPKVEGRCTIAVANRTNSKRLFLLGTFGLYRSDDGGSTWRQTAADDPRIANGQGEYTSGVYIDPQNTDILYTLATCVYRSTDGGKTFEAFKGAPGGDDPQQLWIDPTDGSRLLLGGDQGAVVSLDAGTTWGSWYNQPTGQFYHIGVDNQWPYWIFGTQQDSNSIGTSSRGNLGVITPNDWSPHPGGEIGPMVADPLHPGLTYCYGNGGLIRVMFPSGQWTQVNPRFHEAEALRGPSYIGFSAGDPHELLAGTQFLLSSRDQGSSWRKLSPDLSKMDALPTAAKDKPQDSATIDAVSASPLDGNLIWVATANGRIALTRTHGQTWSDVSISKTRTGRPTVVWLEASGTNRSEAYAVTTSFGQPESKTRIYRTKDFGQSWQEMGAGELPLDQNSASFILRSDPVRSGLLFLSTGNGIFYSSDDGYRWKSLNLNLPVTPFSDMVLHGNDLILATYGRGLWILDDFSPLRELTAKTIGEPVHLFPPATAVRVRRNLGEDTPFPPEVPHAPNPPLGAVIDYSLSTAPHGITTLEILDSSGRVIRHISSAPIVPYHDQQVAVPPFWFEDRKPLPTEVGLNRVTWNLRYDTPNAFFHDPSYSGGAAPNGTPFAIEGPLALPARYSARLTVDGQSYSKPITVVNDPRSPGKQHEMERMHEVQMRLLEEIQYDWDAFQQLEKLRNSTAVVLAAAPPDEVAKAVRAFDSELFKVQGFKERHGMFFVNATTTDFVGLNQTLISTLDGLDYGDVGPTEAVQLSAAEAWSNLTVLMTKLRALNGKALTDLNVLLAKHQVKPIPSVSLPNSFPSSPPSRYLPVAAPKTSAPVPVANGS